VPQKVDSKRPHRRVGLITHLSKSTGNIIANAEGELSVGDFLYDQQGKRVGVVFDFFGPVDAPYIAMKPFVDQVEKLVGEPIYIEEQRTEKKIHRKH